MSTSMFIDDETTPVAPAAEPATEAPAEEVAPEVEAPAEEVSAA